MKAPVMAYIAPDTLEEALYHLHHRDNARILAGGQSLVAMLNMRFAFPDYLIDINRISEISKIHVDDSTITFGAMSRQRDVEFSDVVRTRLPLLYEAILHVGHRQTRNRGTVGGSLCQLDPSAEIPTVAMAMDAHIHIANHKRQRTLPMADFPAAYMTPALDADEMVLSMSLQPWALGHGFCFLEFARRHGDFAIVSCAVLVQLDTQGVIERCAIALGGCAAAPVRVPEAETVLMGTTADVDTIAQAAHVCTQIDASADAYVPSWYRQRLAGVLAGRALARAVQRAQGLAL